MSDKELAYLFGASVILVTLDGLMTKQGLHFHNYTGLIFVWLFIAFIAAWMPDLSKAFAWLYLAVLLLAKGPSLLAAYNRNQGIRTGGGHKK